MKLFNCPPSSSVPITITTGYPLQQRKSLPHLIFFRGMNYSNSYTTTATTSLPTNETSTAKSFAAEASTDIDEGIESCQRVVVSDCICIRNGIVDGKGPALVDLLLSLLQLQLSCYLCNAYYIPFFSCN